jgi:hypothetical protein
MEGWPNTASHEGFRCLPKYMAKPEELRANSFLIQAEGNGISNLELMNSGNGARPGERRASPHLLLIS